MWLYIKVLGMILGIHLLILLTIRYFIQRMYQRDQALLEQEKDKGAPSS